MKLTKVNSDWVEKIPKVFYACDESIIYPLKIHFGGKAKSKGSYVPRLNIH